MNKYGVNIKIDDFYYEVYAKDQQSAMDIAFDLAYDEFNEHNLWAFQPDCNECILLEGEEPEYE